MALTDAQVRVFLEYTRRYEEIVSKLPDQTRLGDLRKADFGKVETVAVRYINLCAEEHFLFLNGAIQEELWAIWKSGIAAYMGNDVFSTAWSNVDKSAYSDDFIQYMNDLTK